MRPDALGAIASYIEREGVSSVRIVELFPEAHAVRCRAGDGSEFFVATDRYGTRFGWADDLGEAMFAVDGTPRNPDGTLHDCGKQEWCPQFGSEFKRLNG